MALSALAQIDRRLSSRFDKPKVRDPSLRSAGGERTCVVIGHGRVGQVVTDLLQTHKFPFIAVDSDRRS